MTSGQTYIVAGCKPWNLDDFNDIARDTPGDWRFVTSDRELGEALSESTPRYVFFLHWNWRVPENYWRRFECVCFHMTDVPYGRGGSPLQNLISAGHASTKVSALRMVEDLDAGPVYAKEPLELSGSAAEIFRRAGGVCRQLIRWMVANEPQPVPQQGAVTIFKRRTPDQSRLPELGDLGDIYNHIRMLDAPTYPAAFIQHGNLRIEFSDASLVEGAVVARVVIRKSDDGGSE